MHTKRAGFENDDRREGMQAFWTRANRIAGPDIEGVSVIRSCCSNQPPKKRLLSHGHRPQLRFSRSALSKSLQMLATAYQAEVEAVSALFSEGEDQRRLELE